MTATVSPLAVALTPDRARLFAGYTADERREAARALSPADYYALAAAEAADLGALVVCEHGQIPREVRREGRAACVLWVRATGALYRATPSRRRAAVDAHGLKANARKACKTRGNVVPALIVEANRVGAARRAA
jgi:hypothetical protein